MDDWSKHWAATPESPGPRVLRILPGPRRGNDVFAPGPWTTPASPAFYLERDLRKAGVQHQLVSQALVIATGITEGRAAAKPSDSWSDDSEDTEVFWTQFPALAARSGS
ncbi:hypothetical protein GCM10020221_25110 [Streptomyces thioluteus]|uniref:Uncharacterized protein n=1 Tax=Streptomyces thioluteus TaxID=66431 RepID=A0ABP6JC77_STRTU